MSVFEELSRPTLPQGAGLGSSGALGGGRRACTLRRRRLRARAARARGRVPAGGAACRRRAVGDPRPGRAPSRARRIGAAARLRLARASLDRRYRSMLAIIVARLGRAARARGLRLQRPPTGARGGRAAPRASCPDRERARSRDRDALDREDLGALGDLRGQPREPSRRLRGFDADAGRLVEAAFAAGAFGARMTGGGFGGSVVALAERYRADESRGAPSSGPACRVGSCGGRRRYPKQNGFPSGSRMISPVSDRRVVFVSTSVRPSAGAVRPPPHGRRARSRDGSGTTRDVNSHVAGRATAADCRRYCA